MGSCDAPLGMEAGAIPDSAITASSSYVPNVGPHNGRLRVERTGGAWCPRRPVERGVRELLQVDLGEVHVLTGVETQGRYDHGRGQEYAEEYTLEYWRPGLPAFLEYSRWDGRKILSGNSDTSTVVGHRLMPPVYASQVRVLPYSVHRRTVCLRVELRGCLAEGGVLSYRAPEEPAPEPGQEPTDPWYDGERRDGELAGGLGMLVDGQVGGDNFRLDIGYGRGNGWVAWRSDSFPDRKVELEFEFDQVRNFSAVHIFANNFFSRGVQVFSKARFLFSVGGEHFNGRPLTYAYMPDTALENARNVSVQLHHSLGRFVRIQLYFAAKWIMISEVLFESVPAEGNFTAEVTANSSEEEILINSEGAYTYWDSFETISAAGDDDGYVEAVIGVLTAVMLLLLVVFVVILVVSRRQKLHGSPTFLRNPFGVTMNMKDLLMTLSPVSGSGVVHAAASQLPGKTPSLLFPACHAASCSALGQPAAVAADEAARRSPGDRSPLGEALGSLQFRSLKACGSAAQGRHPSQCATDPPRKRRCHTAPREKTPSSPHYPQWNIAPAMGHSLKGRELADLVSVPRCALHVVERVGDCHLGEVVLCETRGAEGGRVVAARIPAATADGAAVAREARFLAALADPHVARVLGLCADERPPWVLAEHCDMGDLAHFLQYAVHREAAALAPAGSAHALSLRCLIYMVTQIASGMKYLESKNIVHKDLAARNCFVGRGYKVKIADLAMSSTLYKKDYTEVGERQCVPIRWLPWESIVLERYTCASSSWAYAVTVWEVMSLAREKPFQQLSNQQVMQNAEHMYYGEELKVLLPKPTICPEDIYEVMAECWRRDDGLRPTFREMHDFLKRRSAGHRGSD
ncbi:discoidin domain-containing receptor 2-like [Bacillus rossius redtenbacheri]|uniref:discoidin domain-containing receptor 2-like n=1 Tax=Bacillus rossius redtenbacheri TaxID=93214 RepID=UPI002FDDD1D6